MTDEHEPATGEQPIADPIPDPDAAKPTVGRIVHYTQDVGDEQFVTLAAVVTGTVEHGDAFDELESPWHAHLTVFTPGRAPLSKTNVAWDGTGAEHGTWRWPERV